MNLTAVSENMTDTTESNSHDISTILTSNDSSTGLLVNPESTNAPDSSGTTRAISRETGTTRRSIPTTQSVSVLTVSSTVTAGRPSSASTVAPSDLTSLNDITTTEFPTNRSYSTLSVNSTTALDDTGTIITSETPSKPGDNCLSTIGTVSAISVAFVILVIVTSIVCMLKTKRKWRKKLREERTKTDIWTMSTFNNTIINENFADYTLATTPMPPRRKDGEKWKKNSGKNSRSSAGSRDLMQSWYSDGSRSSGSSIRRNTFSEPNNMGKRFKSRATRQMSEYSEDFRNVDGPYERGRTSTFSVGWNVKGRDRSALVHHEHSLDMSFDDLGGLQLETMTPRNEHIVTEL